MIFIELYFTIPPASPAVEPNDRPVLHVLGVGQRSLQDFHRDGRAGLRVSQSMMVVREVVPACRGDGLELVVGEGAAEMLP